MTETTNLGLPIYGANDVPLWTNTNDGFEALDSLVNSCADVELDWAHPLHTFTDNNLSYTVTEDDCYLCGQTYGVTPDNHIYINDTIIAVAFSTPNFYLQLTIPPIKLSKGDIVRVDNPMTILHVFKGKLVSGNTYVFNEAQVQLDYSDVLAVLTASNNSYTATKDCWLIGSAQNVAITVNDIRIADSSTGYYLQLTPFKLNKGDIVKVTTSGVGYQLCVIGGTVTGSVSAFKREVQRNYYFGLQNGAPVDIDISPLKDTEEITISVEYAHGNSWISERISVSTAKTYNAHILNSQTNIGASVTYVNGKLQFSATNTSYCVVVWVTFN